MIDIKKTYNAKHVEEDGCLSFSDEENHIWSILLQKQMSILKNRACDEYLQGMDLLNLPKDRIPQLTEINKTFKKHTLWTLEPVPSLIKAKTFFNMLSNRKFPVATFIRRLEDMEYIAEPDIFHEIVGHCPLLMHAPYADFLQSYGQVALNATRDMRKSLERLFFFTIETGLIRTKKGLRIYGGGILSSPSESFYALDSDVPARRTLNISEIIETEYGLEKMQTIYYIIENFSALYDLLSKDLRSLTNGYFTNSEFK